MKQALRLGEASAAERASALAGTISERAARSTTIAVTETAEGVRVVSSSKRTEGVNHEIDLIGKELAAMKSRQRLGFGLCLLNRAIPMFYEFQAETNYIGSAEVVAALAACWSALEQNRWGPPRFIDSRACEKIMPDSEDFSSFYTSAAMDAVDICCSLLDFIESQDVEAIMVATRSQLDTVELATQELVHEYQLAEDDETISGKNSLRAFELERMRADLSFLKQVDDESDTFASRLRKHMLDGGYHSVKLITKPQ